MPDKSHKVASTEDSFYMGQKEVLENEEIKKDNKSVSPKLNLQRLERIQRLMQYASVIVLLVFIALIAASYSELKGLSNQKEVTKKEKETLEKEKEALEIDVNSKKADIIDKNKALEETKFSYAIEANRLSDLQKEYAKQKELLKKDNNLLQADGPKQYPIWIYIQIANEGQRKRVAEISNQLKKSGFIVPEMENVGDKAPTNSELRTCREKNDIANRDFEKITSALQNFKIALSQKLNFLSNCGKPDSRQYELWLGKNF